MGTTFILKQDGVHPDLWEIEGDVDNMPEAAFLTFDEIVDDIVTNRLSSGGEEDIKRCSREDLGLLHFSFGMWIRNTYGLWFENNPLTEFEDGSFVRDGVNYHPKHPDAVSSDIIQEVHKRLSGIVRYGDFDDAMKTITEENTHDPD